MKKQTLFIALFALLSATFALSPSAAHAAGCLSFDLSIQRSEADLRQLLAVCEAESKETEQQLAAQRAKSSTIAGDVAVLDSLIKKANQQIGVKNQIIKQLGNQINDKADKIVSLSSKLDRERESLAQILRKKNEIDDISIAEMMMAQKSVSDFFLDMDQFGQVNRALQGSVNTIKGVRKTTAEEKADLENKKDEQNQLKSQIEADKKKTEAQQDEKERLLASSKQAEAEYQRDLASKKAQASAISQKLFALKGVDGGGLQFGQAYQLAKQAGSATGIRPAVILAILKQETNYGANVGQCYLRDAATGDGVGANTGTAKPRTMSPTRDVPVFMAIMKTLGMDYSTTRVSCWIAMYNSAGAPYGWGGAMGISQFIPSTWAGYGGGYVGGVYDVSKDRIRTALGLKAPSSPWTHLHGVTATSLFLKDLGAGARTYEAERSAACKYYAGGAGCSSSGGANYGNSVMNYAAQIQKDIDVLESVR